MLLHRSPDVWSASGPAKNWTYKGVELTSMHFTVINPHLGLFGPSKFWNYIQNLTYDHGTYEARVIRSANWSLALQPLVAYQAYMAHMKAIDVFFYLMYGSSMCSKGLQSDRPKWRGMSEHPRRASLCKAVSKTMLEWCENRRCLNSLPVIWLFLRVRQAIIPHLKEDIQG